MKRTKRCVALAVSALMLSTIVSVNFNKAYAAGINNEVESYEEDVNVADYKSLEDIPMGIVGDYSDDDADLEEEEVQEESENIEDEESIDDSELEIESDDIEDINSSNFFGVRTTNSSITVQWIDNDSANATYKVIATSSEPIQLNTPYPDIQAVEVTGKNAATVTGLASGMSYDLTLYKNGVSVGTTKSTTLPEFLIIVGESLYSGIKSNLDIYKSDLRYKEGIGAEVLRVSKTSTVSGVSKVTTPSQLKGIIKNKYQYGNGIKGFVIIGSGSDIPTARVERQSDGNDKWVSDLYYADMNGTWNDSDNDGFFEDPTSDSQKYIPELYYGRINPKGVVISGDSVTTISKQVSYINNYLAKVHAYRNNGNQNLPDMVRKRSCIFNDAQFASYKDPAKSYCKLFVNTYNIGDQNYTTADKLVDVLNLGYGMINLMVHSSNTLHQVWTINDSTGTKSYQNLTISDLDSKLGATDPMFNYMNMYCCSGCKFENNYGTATNNLGAYYLFKSGTGLNITGATTSAGILTDENFYNELGNGKSIGEAFCHFFTTNSIFMNLHSTFVLLGDPTLKYGFTRPQSAAPYITTNLNGTFNDNGGHYYQATAGTPFRIYFNDIDNSSSQVYYSVTGTRPAGTTITKTNNYISINVPTASTCDFRVSLYNKNGNDIINCYVENFHVKVN